VVLQLVKPIVFHPSLKSKAVLFDHEENRAQLLDVAMTLTMVFN